MLNEWPLFNVWPKSRHQAVHARTPTVYLTLALTRVASILERSDWCTPCLDLSRKDKSVHVSVGHNAGSGRLFLGDPACLRKPISPCCLATANPTRATNAALFDVPKDDAAFGQIIRRQFECDFIAGQDADKVFLQATSAVGDQFVAVVEVDAEALIGEDFHDRAVHFDEFFFCHGAAFFAIGARCEKKARFLAGFVSM